MTEAVKHADNFKGKKSQESLSHCLHAVYRERQSQISARAHERLPKPRLMPRDRQESSRTAMACQRFRVAHADTNRRYRRRQQPGFYATLRSSRLRGSALRQPPLSQKVGARPTGQAGARRRAGQRYEGMSFKGQTLGWHGGGQRPGVRLVRAPPTCYQRRLKSKHIRAT